MKGRIMFSRSSFRRFSVLFAALTALASASTAFAEVKHEGAWPEKDKSVSLDVSGASRSEAVKRVADAAGWSIVTDGVGSGNVDLHIKDQPAGRILDLVLDDGSYVATRDGDLVRIRRAEPAAAATPAPAAPPVPVAPAAPEQKAEKADKDENPLKGDRGEDRTIFGSNVTIEANETVKDVSVFGGNVDVLGHVTGDLTVLGGNVHVKGAGHVDGDASLLGGNLTLDDGTSVGKDVSVLGGNFSRADGAKVGGEVQLNQNKKHKNISIKLDEDERPGVTGFLSRVGHRLTNMAILFVFGTILLALAAGRMESMRVEVAARPMRTFALGVVSFIGACIATVILCVTIIGIPLAVVGVLLAVFAGYAGATAALTTFGAAVLQHRTQSPYVHLAFGCLALFIIGWIPVIGGLASLLVGAVGFGAIIATRAAGFLAPKRDLGPYRTA
jgi:hypothetical protein